MKLRTKLEWVIALAVCALLFAAIGAFLYPVYADSMWPPPQASHLRQMQQSLDEDGLPVVADKVIACEMDRASYVGEGVANLTQLGHRPQEQDASFPQTIIVQSRTGDYARVMHLGGGRVRVYVGGGLDQDEVIRVFDKEFRTGKGQHPPYVKP